MTPTKLNAERLEDRNMPSVFGNPWQLATELTMSFANEGVQYSTQAWGQSSFASRLYSELGGTLAQNVWQEELLRAMHAWTAFANINVGLVADSGRAFGPADFQVGEPTSNIRVGTIATGTDVLATSMPFHPLTGTYAGSVMLNEAWTFTRGGAPGTYDLFTVALHEFGNALGLSDLDSSTANAMYGHYLGTRTGLSAADISAVRALYGARQADATEATNNARTTAPTLANVGDPNDSGKVRVVANGDITTAGDADWYRFVTTSGTSQITVRLGTAGKSLLAGRVEVYDGNGRLLAARTNTSPLQGDTVLTVTGLRGNTAYFVRVSAGRTDTFNTGAYQLRVGNGYDPKIETLADRVQRFGSDSGTNDTRATATVLTPTAGYATNSHYEWTGAIEQVGDNDFYKLTAPPGGGIMTISVQSDSGLSTSATVYTSNGTLVASNIILNWEHGTYRAQVPFTLGNGTYYVQLKVQDANWGSWSGNYHASVDFSQPLVTADKWVAGTATASSQIVHGIEVLESGTFVFRLTALSSNRDDVDWLEARIFSAQGQLVAVWGTDGLASTDTLTAFLAKGRYTIQLVPAYTNPNSSAFLAYSLGLNRLSDPIDPYLPPDPLSPPPPPPPPPPPGEKDGVRIITPPWNPWLPLP
jgi:hypothetical protein